MEQTKLISREELPVMVADAVRRIRGRCPQFQSHLPKRFAQFTGKSTSYAEKVLFGQLSAMDPLLLNLNSFLDGELLRELLGHADDERAERILEHLREIERLSRL